MSKKIILPLMLATLVAGLSTAQAHENAPSLLGALVSVGNHGSVANIGAAVGSRNPIADVGINLLGGAVKANVDVGQSGRQSNTLLGISATVLDGGVGRRSGW